MPQRSENEMPFIEAWAIQPATRVWVGGNNVHARKVVEENVLGALRPVEGPIDTAFITPASNDECTYFARKLRFRLVDGAPVWVVLPRPGSPNADAFQGDADNLTIEMFEAGYEEAGRAAINEQYASLAFKKTL